VDVLRAPSARPEPASQRNPASDVRAVRPATHVRNTLRLRA